MDRFKKKTDENGERTSLKIKISMRKTAKMIAVVSCTILMLAACSPKKQECLTYMRTLLKIWKR